LISRICRDFEKQPSPPKILSHFECTQEGFQEPFLHLLPPIIIWAPLEQFKNILPNGLQCPKCETINSVLFGCGWKDGVESERSEPRKIHGRDGIVLLVGRVYKCSKKGHEVASYHPGVLRQINAKSLIIFRLWLKTGYTTDFIRFIETMILSGLRLSAIQKMLDYTCIEQYSLRKKQFIEIQRIFTTHMAVDFPSFDDWKAHLPTLTPSRHAIAGCFLSSFWEKDKMYEKHMQCTSLTEEDGWLSCDHTFASAGEKRHIIMNSIVAWFSGQL
jgi:hypothetical protein